MDATESRRAGLNKPIGLLKLLERSADLLEKYADGMRDSHTVCGRWPLSHDPSVRMDYHEMRFLASRLRGSHNYHYRNCLGGPAKMFDAIADRIRAGESVQSCMEDFGLSYSKQVEAE